MRSLSSKSLSLCSQVIALFLMSSSLAMPPSVAQSSDLPAGCGTAKDWVGHVYFCATQSLSASSVGRLSVDGGENGSIEVRNGADSMVHIIAVKTAWLPIDDDGKAILSGVRVNLDGQRLSSQLARSTPGLVWGVSFRIEVPSNMALEILTVNGSVDIEGTLKRVSIHSVNGAIRLNDLHLFGADVHRERAVSNADPPETLIEARTQNGSVEVSLPKGEEYGMTARTTLGRITLSPLPAKRLLQDGRTAVVGADRPVQADVGSVNGNVRIISSSW